MNDETYPPEVGHGQMPSADKPPKQKINWPFAILGFFTPTVVITLIVSAMSALSNVVNIAPAFGSLGGILQIAVIIAAIAAFVVGSRRGDNRMRSFGIGALWAYVAYTLIALLAFGACLISLGGNGGGIFGG